MDAHPRLLVDLAVVLGVASATSLLFQRLRLPAVLGYLLAGMIVGPHVPVPLVANLANVRIMGELGVILLMFSIGLEFSLQRLLRAGPTALLTGTLQVGTLLVAGFLVARLLGWPPLESAFFGASLSIASTMILAKPTPCATSSRPCSSWPWACSWSPPSFSGIGPWCCSSRAW